jgi:hypothetical protein
MPSQSYPRFYYPKNIRWPKQMMKSFMQIS